MRCLAAVAVSMCVYGAAHAGEVVFQVRNIAQVENGSLINPPRFAAGDTQMFFIAREDEFGEELYVTDGTPAGTRLVADLNPGPGTADVSNLTMLGDTVFFRARVTPFFTELWKSDGTEAGTMLVKDLWPGNASTPANLYAANGKVFFSAIGEGIGRELGISDGTEAGTFLVDLNPGADASNPESFTAVGDLVFFVATVEGLGRELWVTDGTAEGTRLVKELRPGPDPGFIGEMAAFNGLLYFSGREQGDFTNRLFVSDGTEEGTVRAPVGNLGSPAELAPTPGALYFTADPGSSVGRELHRLDAITGEVRLVKDINPGSGAQNSPEELTPLGNLLVFRANDGVTGWEPWVSDGTEDGTFLLRDIVPGSGESYPYDFQEAGGKVYFVASTPGAGDELWVTDGTVAGTQLLKDILPGPDSSFPSDLTAFDGRLFFGADDGLNGREPWVSDGTPEGTELFVAINDKTSSSQPGFPFRVGDRVLFGADDGVTGRELWITDGTFAGTQLLKDINPGQEGSGPIQFTELNGTILFAAFGVGIGQELYKTDLTTAGTVLVKDIREGANGSSPTGITPLGPIALFSATDDTHGDELWKTDGTEAGTVLVKDIRAGSASSSPDSLTRVGDRVFFAARTDDEGFELWKSDGTEAGTQLVRDINPGDASSSPQGLTALGDTLIFSAETAANGRELWRSDGTNGGTVLVRDINPGAASSDPTGMIAYNGVVLFAADDGVHGRELWRTDGTNSGTFMVKDINAGAADSNPSFFVEAGGLVYFAANDGEFGNEVWLTDGTEEGTRLAFDARPGPGGSTPQNLTPAGDHIYFSAIGLTTGRELYRTDGTPEGSRIVRDLFPGQTGSFPSSMLWMDDYLLFSANDGVTGAELWALIPGAPRVERVDLIGESPTNADTVAFEVAFTEAVVGVTAADFLPVALSGDLAGIAVQGVTGSGALYTVTVNTGTGSGSFRLHVIDNGTIVKDDDSGLPLVGVGTDDGTFTTALPIVMDRVLPVVTFESFTTDVTAPTLMGTTDSPTAEHTVRINGTVLEAGTSITPDGPIWIAQTFPIAPLPAGVYEIVVEATNAIGNTGTVTGTLTVILEPPVVSVFDLVTGLGNPQLRGATDAPAVPHQAFVDGVPIDTVTGVADGETVWFGSTNAIAPLDEGMYEITVEATRAPGTVGTATGSLIVDKTPPVVTLIGPEEIVLRVGIDPYVEFGAMVTDNFDPEPQLLISGGVNENLVGTYLIQYRGVDWVFNTSDPAIRRVIVQLAQSGDTGVLGPNGGTLVAATGPLADRGAIIVPQGTLTGPTEFSISNDDDAPAPPAGRRLYAPTRLTPAGASFDPPVTVELPFDVAPDDPDFEPSLGVYYYDEEAQEWRRDGITEVAYQHGRRLVVFDTTHFTTFGILTLQGDLNLDGFVNAVDVQLVINAALGISIAPLDGNVDGDEAGAVNAIDVQITINRALGIL